MLTTIDDIAKFIAFAPDASEGTAIRFLEGANTIDEAVGQYYENPEKYAHKPTPIMPGVGQDTKDTKYDKETSDSMTAKETGESKESKESKMMADAPPTYNQSTTSNGSTTGASLQPTTSRSQSQQYKQHKHHTNAVIEAGHLRARDEQEMQNLKQSLQLAYHIYNSDIEPEHEIETYCNCPIHQYRRRKINRLGVQKAWSNAVMYPASVRQTIDLNAYLNAKAQADIDAKEPPMSIWEFDTEKSLRPQLTNATDTSDRVDEKKRPVEKPLAGKRQSIAGSLAGNSNTDLAPAKTSKLAGLKKALAMKTPEEKVAAKEGKMMGRGRELREAIISEEVGRWPDDQWRKIVAVYQDKVGMTQKIADLRARQPTQYLHLLRAGYFEPIPVAWANLASNPLKFSIEAAGGWRGITPAWRGYEDTAEERLYWVLNHREGSAGVRLKPDLISAMNLARARMAMAVEPPPEYFSNDDTCHLQHTSDGYSKQVLPPPFRAYDAPETVADDTMILLDVSGSMDFDPLRPNYNEYLITGYSHSTQPKNKDVAKAIIRRFTDAMANHDHNFRGYQLTTFANSANYIGTINHKNLSSMWRNVRIGGGTRVMTGWQKVKDLHFQKHSESATYHPVYGWQAGPQTPILRLLLLLDGEATDMDEFELDLLGLSWVHVTIFLIGVDGCPHHHRHANELQRISEVNHHVSFVDAQGNTPERFVTHELLKRHLGYEVSMAEFVEMEHPPAYVE
ncbi:hypothetical protein MMC25_003828 [Agyrium rufum]|nr:hypothetical protein [Agyrium rufum]